MTSSSASSPSLNKLRSPSQDDAASAAARFNPLFIHTGGNSAHGLRHRGYNSANLPGPSSVAQAHSQGSERGNFMAAEDKNKARHRALPAGNPPSSPNLLELEPPAAIASRKVQVVYYLSRSGQLEHPHLLEVTVPSHQGLHLRDVKKRLAMIRGKLLPATFAWSYKRSYKNGYVWQDLCDDDLIFPAHGCEYVLKGSEILADQRTVASEEATAQDAFTETRSVTQSGVTREDKVLPCRSPKLLFYDEPACPVMGHASMHVSMVESGTDAATQTEEDARSSAENDSNDHDQSRKGLHSKHEGFLSTKSHRESFASTRPQKATELNKAEIASPPFSSSTTDSPSPYSELASATSSSNSVGNHSIDRSKPAADLIKPGSKTPGRPWMIKSIQELDEQDESPCINAANNGQESTADGFLATNDSTSKKVKYRSVPANGAAPVTTEELHLPAANMKPGRAKQSSALSLLQFMSCGGLDIKEQILPMSLYRLRSRGTPGMTNQFVMSNYVLSPEHSSCESFITYSGSDCVKPWSRTGKLKSLGPECLPNGSKPVGNLSGEYVNGELDTLNSGGQSHHPQSIQGNLLSPESGSGSMAKVQGISMSDVISIARSSMSDRSTNVSHELDFQASNIIAMLKKSDEVPNISDNASKDPQRLVAGVRPELSADLCQNSSGLCHNEPTRPAITARAVSGDVFVNKSSPLFVPGRRHLSYSGTPLHNCAASGAKPLSQSVKINYLQSQTDEGKNVMLMRQDDAHNRNTSCSGASCNPSRAFSDGEVSCMLSNRNLLSKSGDQASGLTINGYDQSMAQLWEELLSAPSAVLEEHQQRDGDLRRVRQLAMGGNTAWEVERTLQNAVELSLQPPLENHLLNVDCPHCGRKMKSELMKAHIKSCNSPKSPSSSKSTTSASHYSCLNTNLNSFGKSPKSNSNLCQRFLRASPTNL